MNTALAPSASAVRNTVNNDWKKQTMKIKQTKTQAFTAITIYNTFEYIGS